MTERQHRVISTNNLLLRTSGAKENIAVGAATPGTIVHVVLPANVAGYVQGYVFGWLGTDHKVLYTESLAPNGGPVDALVYRLSAFRPIGAQDVYGRQPGELHGWLAVKFLEAIE